MRKSNNFLKLVFMFVLVAAMMTATAVTAFAYDEDFDNTVIESDEQAYALDADDEPNNIQNDNDDNNGTINYPPNEPPLGSLIIINSTHAGQPLHGAVFGLYRVGENIRFAELATDTQGRTQEIPLPQGNYFLTLLIPSHNHMSIVDRIYVSVSAGQRQEITIFSVPIPQEPEPTPIPPPEPTPPPVETGRLLITLRAHGTNQLLSGAIFELRRAMDNELVAHLITDMFGEAAFDLPVGDYFLREIQHVSGFIPNPDRVNVRIAANRLNEVNLTSRPEPAPTPPPTQTPPPQETAPQPGRLIVTLTTEGTRQPIQGAIFEVRRAIDNRLMAEIITDRFGEAAVNLAPDDYFLRQITTAQGFEFNSERSNVRIAAGAVREISVANRPIPPYEPPQEEAPPAEVLRGRLLIDVVSADTGNRIEGAVFTIHDVMTDELIATIITNAFGEASAHLPPGQYFKRNTAMPQGYNRDMERINFTIRAEAITNMTVTARAIPQPTPTPTPTPTEPVPSPTPAPTAPTATTTNRPAATTPTQNVPVTTPNRPQGQNRVEIITRAEISGNPLHGATFGVYRAIDSQRVGEVTTDANGRAVIYLNAGEFYLRNTSVQLGFLQERARIFFTVAGSGGVTVEVMIQRDGSIPYADYGIIDLPQTGELTPIMNYTVGGVLMLLSLFSAAMLWKQHKQDKADSRQRKYRNRRGALGLA